MINLKTIILVVILAICIGVTYVILTGGKVTPSTQIPNNASLTTADQKPTPTPWPSWPPLNDSSNLEDELLKTNPADFSEDFKKLKGEAEKL